MPAGKGQTGRGKNDGKPGDNPAEAGKTPEQIQQRMIAIGRPDLISQPAASPAKSPPPTNPIAGSGTQIQGQVDATLEASAPMDVDVPQQSMAPPVMTPPPLPPPSCIECGSEEHTVHECPRLEDMELWQQRGRQNPQDCDKCHARGFGTHRKFLCSNMKCEKSVKPKKKVS